MEGLHNYAKDQVLAVAGLKIGQTAGKEDFESARDRLVAAGVFETVGYRFAPAAAGAFAIRMLAPRLYQGEMPGSWWTAAHPRGA